MDRPAMWRLLHRPKVFVEPRQYLPHQRGAFRRYVMRRLQDDMLLVGGGSAEQLRSRNLQDAGPLTINPPIRYPARACC